MRMNQERVDENNGLLLIPNLDSLFDKYLITFQTKGDDIGKIKISKNINS